MFVVVDNQISKTMFRSILFFVCLLGLSCALPFESRVVNGTNADILEFPYVVSTEKEQKSLNKGNKKLL